jgi:multimeric flavodoxin WrbA
MPLNVLGISTSPREGGNTDVLLGEALAGAEAAGARTERLSLRALSIAPCSECCACARTGVCRIEDDYQAVMKKMLEADRLILATPVFFMGPCAQAKLLIDRCQCLWSRKYLLKQPVSPDGPSDRRAMVIAVGGSKSRKMFECVRMTMKYWLDALGCAYAANLFVNQVDQRGEARTHAEAMKEAFRLGRTLAGDAPLPPQPETIELFGPAGAARP